MVSPLIAKRLHVSAQNKKVSKKKFDSDLFYDVMIKSVNYFYCRSFG